MKGCEFLEQWGLAELKLHPRVLAGRLPPRPADRTAAWELRLGLAACMTARALPRAHGDEKTALQATLRNCTVALAVLTGVPDLAPPETAGK